MKLISVVLKQLNETDLICGSLHSLDGTLSNDLLFSFLFFFCFAAAGMAELAGLVQRLEAAVGRLESMSGGGGGGGGPAAGGGKEPPSGLALSPPPEPFKKPPTHRLSSTVSIEIV